ncbi:MAG: IS66 family transposase [Candidatus Kariarchaeaceae archaeon]
MELPFDEKEIIKDPEAMLKLIQKLMLRVQSLERQLNSSSHFSQRSFSTDPKKEKESANWNIKTPDIIIHYFVRTCKNCQQEAPEEDQKISYSKRIMEMPQVAQIEIQEVHIHKFTCPSCNMTTQAAEPTLKGTSLGPKFLSFLTTARFHTGSSFENLSQLISDNTGIKPSQTALNRGLAAVCDLLEPFAEEIALQVINSEWITIDSTEHAFVEQRREMKTQTKTLWIWVFASPEVAYFSIDFSQSKNALYNLLKKRNLDLPPLISVSHCNPIYMEPFKEKQLCWACLLDNGEKLAGTSSEGQLFYDGLIDLNERVNEIRTKLLNKTPIQGASEAVYQTAIHFFDELIELETDSQELNNLQKHLKQEAENYLTCLKYPNIPMTNLFSTRLLNSVILHQTHGPLRSIKAITQYGTLLSVLTTWNLQEIPIQEKLFSVLNDYTSESKLLELE